MRRTPTILALPVVAGAVALAACTPATDDAATPEPTPPPTPSATPTPVPYEIPGDTDDEFSRLVYDADDDPPTVTSVTSRPVVADEDFAVRAQCEGDTVEFSVLKALPGDEAGETLMEGTIDCEHGRNGGFSYRSAYAGPVQLTVGDTSAVDRVWIVLRPAA